MISLFKNVVVASMIFLVLAICPNFVSSQKALAATWEQIGTGGFGVGATNLTLVSLVEFNDVLYGSAGNVATGVQIFKSTDGQTWTQTNTSGFGSAANLDAILTVYNSALYATTDQIAGPAEVWKTTDGITWVQVGTAGLGDVNNKGIIGATVFNGKLYLGTSNTVTNAEVFSIDANGVITKVNLDGFDGTTNIEAWSLKEYNGVLYAGTNNPVTGAELWKTINGTSWTKVMDGGFGDVTNIRINSLFTFGGELYAGTLNQTTGTEVWRTTTSDTAWEQANTDGFGDTDNTWTGDTVAVINGVIYLGTRNDTDGARLFISTNGTTWTQEGSDGFGDVGNYAIYAMTFNGRVYIGFSNGITGAEVWRTGAMATLSISTTSLSEGTVNSAYSQTLATENGTTPITFSSSGSLPDGLTLNSSTGEISGTPTKDGTFSFTVTASDMGSPQQTATRDLSIKINALPVTLPETGMDKYLGWAIGLI